jgi:hypothetical protein
MMSDTPKTDAEVDRVKQQCRGEYHLEGGDFVTTEFAKKLERELNEAIERAAEKL